MRLEEALEVFERHLKARGFSPRTVEAYGPVLKRLKGLLLERWVEDLAQVTSPLMLDFQDMEKERLTREGKPVAVHTANIALRVVRHFFGVLREEGHLWVNPARVLVLAKEPQTLPRSILSAKEVKSIVEAPDLTTSLGYRDRCILEVLYSTGIRRNELIGLKVTDLDLEGGFLRVNQGKGGKDRVVPLGKVACSYLKGYLDQVRSSFIRGDTSLPWLFISKKGNQMSEMVPRKLVERYRREAGVPKKVTPHTFRHTCATLMLKNRANIRHIQELLGHESLETTKVYTAVTVSDLKAVHKRCHPRERVNDRRASGPESEVKA